MGFGVARSTTRAMPEPRCVGRVTDRLPRFFLYISITYIINSHEGELLGIIINVMTNIDFELKKEEGELFISYCPLGSHKIIHERGFLSGDGQSFVVTSKNIDNCYDLSLTEKMGLKKYVSRESLRKGHPNIIF